MVFIYLMTYWKKQKRIKNTKIEITIDKTEVLWYDSDTNSIRRDHYE